MSRSRDQDASFKAEFSGAVHIISGVLPSDHTTGPTCMPQSFWCFFEVPRIMIRGRTWNPHIGK